MFNIYLVEVVGHDGRVLRAAEFTDFNVACHVAEYTFRKHPVSHREVRVVELLTGDVLFSLFVKSALQAGV